MQTKFKVGDTVRCVVHKLLDTTYGKVYKVTDVSESNGNLFFKYIDDVGDCAERLQIRFALVQEDAVLTPEEVFEHLRKGTKLQYKQEVFPKGWRDCSNPQFADILNREWRIKPEPEVIELNGKRYKLIEE